ncbi:MAG: agmatinase [Gammaproteobacteria bacterium]|nr:agmatinase [Gammaproteobacteria bacterium]
MGNNHFSNSFSMHSNIFGYLGAPLSRNLDEADVFVIGLPYDLATTGRSGTRSGPAAIRQASANLRWEEKRFPWNFNVSDKIRIADYGDLEFPAGNHEAFCEGINQHYDPLLSAGKTTLSFGGDHFVTLPLMRAHQRAHGKLAMIHFDAHTDTYPEQDSVYNHGSMFYHAPREGLIDAEHSIQVGIRTEYTKSKHEFEVINAAEANDLSADEIVSRIKRRVGDLPCYLTFDIDCLDPAYAPGTGTPVIGGLSSDRALKIIRGLVGLNLVGMDLVEVAPSYDHAEITALAGATLGLEMLYVLGANKK